MIHTHSKHIKLAICTMVWKRPEIFEMFAKGIKAIYSPGVEIKVFVAGSEGKASHDMVRKHGFEYTEYSNDALAMKANAPLQMIKEWGADFVMFTGSDDIMSQELFELYVGAMKQNADFIGVTDWYFYDTVSKTASYWGGYLEPYRKGKTCGAFRVLSKRVLNEWRWRVFEPKHNKILDNSMDVKLKLMDHTSCTFSMRTYGVLAVDVKSTTNMTPYELWPNTKQINPKKLTDKFSYLCAASQ